MKGDFSRWSFDPKKEFSRVLMQQGRVQLDADWNEQVAIQLHQLRSLAKDLIGPHGGPEGDGFKVVSCWDSTNKKPVECSGEATPEETFYVLPGHYYVDGILCRHDGAKVVKYEDQPGCSMDDLKDNQTYLVYLDVWERHITFREDEVRADDPSIREVALGGPDTTTRAKLVWQLKLAQMEEADITCMKAVEALHEQLNKIRGQLAELRLAIPPTKNLAELWVGLSDSPETRALVLQLLNANIGQIKKQNLSPITFPDEPDCLPGRSDQISTLITRLNGFLSDLSEPESADAIGELRKVLEDAIEPIIERVEAEIAKLQAMIQNQRCNRAIKDIHQLSPAHLKARADANGNGGSNEPCTIPPEAQYRGPENRLYRVEIHTGGSTAEATFKWSRENGSIAFRIEKRAGSIITLKDWWRDNHQSVQINDWVEIIDDNLLLHQKPGYLIQVVEIDDVAQTVTIEIPADTNLPEYDEDSDNHPLLRRWDQSRQNEDKFGQFANGVIKVKEGNGESDWIELEDGVKIQFQENDAASNEYRKYRTGDYWLIPARTEIGNVIWPGPVGNPEAWPPLGIEHHYAPLAIIEVNGGRVQVVTDCRRIFQQLGQPVGA